MFEIIKPNINIDFVSKRRFWFAITALAVLASFVLFFTKGLNYGIDFTGGAEIQIRVPVEWDIEKVRSAIEDGGLEGARVQQIGLPEESHYMIKTQGEEDALREAEEMVETSLSKELNPDQFQILKSDVVGPAAGETLRQSGLLAMIYSLIAILIYVTLRFDSRFAPGLVLALVHDAMLVVGLFILTGKTFDLQILASILALIGYSCNDTIVIYDRIREVQQLYPKLRIEEAVNRSVNETLSRTLLTTLTTFFVVFSLWMFGGPVLEDFAFALMAGMILGTYSTIFVASSLVITLTYWYERRAARARANGKSKGWGRHQPQPRYHV